MQAQLQQQAQAQTQAIGMTLVRMKFSANASTSIWILQAVQAWGNLNPVFSWPNFTVCGKYSCACVLPEQYLIFTCCSTRKRKILIPVLVLALLPICLHPGHCSGDIRIVLVQIVKTGLWCNDRYSLFQASVKVKYRVIRATFLATCCATLLLCKLQSFVAIITTPASNLPHNKFHRCWLQQRVAWSRTACNMLLQLAALKFVARQVACGGGNTGKSNNVAWQVARKCCPYYLAFRWGAVQKW